MKKLITLAALAVMLAGCDNVSMAQYRRQPVAAAAQVSRAEPTQPAQSILTDFAAFDWGLNVPLAALGAMLTGFFGWVFTGGYAKDRHGNPR